MTPAEASVPITNGERIRAQSPAEVFAMPVSSGQQRVWFLQQLQPGIPLYNVPIALRLEGPLDAALLEQALNQVIQRHETLRTRFGLENGEPIQIIEPALSLKLSLVELPGLSPAEREAEAARLADAEARKPIDLEGLPLFRGKLVRLSEAEHILVLVFHHIIFDGWSRGVFFRELIAFYEGLRAGRPAELPALSIQYADFAVWQRERLHTLDRQLAWWKKRLSGPMPVLELPADRARPAVQTYAGAVETLALPAELLDALNPLCRQEKVTLFMALLATFQTLLHRYTGQKDILTGSPVSGRHRPETESLIGFFVNTLVFRADLSGNPTVHELLRRVRESAVGAYANEELPFERLVQELQPTRDLSHSPLFQVMFALEQTPFDNIHWPGLKLTFVEIDTGTAKFDLSLHLVESAQGLKARMEYNTDLFDADTIRRMLNHFRILLEGIVARPDARVSDLPLLSGAERHQVLVEWNQTQAEFPVERTVHELFERQAALTPNAVALVFGNRQLTYRELDGAANRLAHYLQRLGVKPDTLVGLCLDRSVEMVVGLLGILKAGGACIPFDPTYPRDRLAFMLEDSRASPLVTELKLLAALPKRRVRKIYLDSERKLILRESAEKPPTEVGPEDLACVIYTSGSTGGPNGVSIPHRAVVNLLNAMRQEPGLASNDVLLAITPLSVDQAILELFLPLTVGARVVLAGREEAADTRSLAARMAEAGVTLLHATPDTWQRLVESGWPGNKSLKMFCGGEPLSRPLARKLLERGAELWNLYGSAETTICSTAAQIEPGADRIVVGRPIANTRAYILDGRLQPVPLGVPGELCIAGDGLARGYLNRPELTAEKFIPDPFGFQPEARLYRTGELARWRPGGTLEQLGRLDYRLTLRGFRIEPGEIETLLLEAPGVREAVVVVREDRPGDKRLVAYLTSYRQPSVSLNELRRLLRDKLPDYLMPAAFVLLESLPLTPHGKVDRRALPSPDLGTVPEQTLSAPRTPTEELVAGIWSEVLGISHLAVQDNFFELGGHSLLASQVVARIGKVFQVALPLQAVFEAPTISGLAGKVDALRHASEGLRAPPLVVAAADAEIPLSFAQENLWMQEQAEPGLPLHNIPMALRLRGALQVSALEQALSEILRRHQVLRTSVVAEQGCPRALSTPAEPVALSVINLSHWPAANREAEVRRLIAAEARHPFDLTRSPLLRAKLARLDTEEHLLLLTMHQLVGDGWSLRVLARELAELYNAFLQGHPSPLPELPIQYADWARWQRQWMQGDVLEKQLAYWKEKLAPPLPVLCLPSDHPQPAAPTRRGATERFVLSPKLYARLRRVSRQEKVTLFMLLLAAFKVLLHRYTGQEDILVGSPVAGRTQIRNERLIGLFVNTLVFRTSLSGNLGFRALLERIRQVALGAYAHQEVPFEKLVEVLQPDRNPSRPPLFQAMFAFLNAAAPPVKWVGLRLTSLPVETGAVKYDLSLTLEEDGQRLAGLVEYRTDLFKGATIARMVTHYRTLLEGIVARPDRRIASLPLLDDAERAQVLVKWNDSRTDYHPRDKCLHQLFEQQVQKTPDAVAVRFQSGSVTYGELNQAANEVTQRLQGLGVGPDSIVAVCLEPSAEMLPGVLGVLKAGGAYLPLDHACPKERLEFMLKDSGARVLLTQKSLREHFRFAHPYLRPVCLDEPEPMPHPASRIPDSKAPVSPDNPACVFYTTDLEGNPIGVPVHHRALVNLLFSMWRQPGIGRHDVLLALNPLFFDIATLELFLPLSVGARVELASNQEAADGRQLAAKIESAAATVMQATPATWRLLLNAGWRGSQSFKMLCGSQGLTTELATELLSRGELWNLYGATETTIWSTVYKVESGQGPIPIGRPIANTQVFILDALQQPVPIGVPGELFIGGDGLTRGYLNQPERTAEKFIPHPFHEDPEARLYKTGDLARYRADGSIEYLGRIGDQVE